MKIRDLLAVESIDLNGKVTGKNEALDAMVALMAKSGKINDVEKYRKGVYAREEEGTTGIGEGIAIPHCKSDAVSRPGLAAMVIKDGVDFDALDGEKVSLIFLIAAPNTEDNVHLIKKINSLGIDLNGLVDYAESLYNSFKNGDGSSNSGIAAAVGGFFKSIISFSWYNLLNPLFYFCSGGTIPISRIWSKASIIATAARVPIKSAPASKNA